MNPVSTISVSARRCPQNHRCPALRFCPTDAITQDGYGLPVIDQDKCVRCGKCFRVCPMGAFVENE